MHPALRQGPLFTKNTPHFPLCFTNPPPFHFLRACERTSKFKSVSDWQDEMLLCDLFLYIWVYITDCVFVFCIFYLAAFTMHYALHLAIAPETQTDHTRIHV